MTTDEGDGELRITPNARPGAGHRPAGRPPLPPGEKLEARVTVKIRRELYAALWRRWSDEGKRGSFSGWIREGFAERARRREK